MVHTTRVLGPCRAMDTGREHGCQKMTPVLTGRGHGRYLRHPCSRVVDTGVKE